MRLIVGLGNPGKEFEGTRHNLGFDVVERMAHLLGVSAWKSQCDALVAKGQIDGEGYLLAKPQTFMNNSGHSVAALLHYYRVDPADYLVITDDLELPPGKIRIRLTGSDGGHNGLKSIARQTGSRDYKRMRLGIGHPRQLAQQAGGEHKSTGGGNVRSYVLGKSREDQEVFARVIDEAARLAIDFARGGALENWSSPDLSAGGAQG